MTDQELTRLLSDLAREVPALRRSIQELAQRTVQSETDIARSRLNIRIVAGIAVAGLAVGGVVFAARTEGQQQQISRNAERLAQVVHAQCVIQDQTAARQIELLDSAIATERRKPRPDPKRIADLVKFRPDRIDCGTPP